MICGPRSCSLYHIESFLLSLEDRISVLVLLKSWEVLACYFLKCSTRIYGIVYDSHEDFTNVNEVTSISLLWWLLWALSLVLVLIATFSNLSSLPEKKKGLKQLPYMLYRMVMG